MARNRDGRFSMAPQVDVQRTRMTRSFEHATSFNVGQLVPIFLDPVYPGDTFEVKTSYAARLQTLITPIMGNLYLDTYFFFVPNRLVWKHWKNFCGENTESAWIPETTYTIPQIEAPEGGWNVGTIADHLGLPVGVDNISVSALPFRALALIINEFFRDENLQNPLNIPDDETTVTGVNTGTFTTDVAKGGLPFVAAKFHDYFTSALPGPQKGDPISISLVGDVPVFGNGSALGLTTSGTSVQSPVLAGLQASKALSYGESYQNYLIGNTTAYGKSLGTVGYSDGIATIGSSGSVTGVPTKAQLGSHPEKSGLVADISSASAISVNTLRLAFAMQKALEKDSRSGSRYIEILKGHFGVTSPDGRLQRPEYLGGHRKMLNVNQVVQTSATGAETPQGNVAGYSLTTDSHGDFSKSFTEHGYVIGLACVRYDHLYQQGIERHWSNVDRFDLYWPVFQSIGEQGIKNKEIFAQGTDTDDEIFGYQEAFADLRYKPSSVSGEMRSAATTSLDIWHLADDYNSLPLLGDSWIQEDSSTVDRVLAVTSSVSNQVFADFYFDFVAVRPMPLYSIPGMIDHF